VAQEDWNGARIHPGVPERGGKAVAQRVNAPPVGKPRPLPSALRDLARRATGHGALGVVTRQEPRRRPLQTPLGAQCLSEAGGSEGGASLLAFALIAADHQALRMARDVGDVEGDHCTDASPRRGRRHEEGTVRGVAGAGQEPFNVRETADLGEVCGRRPWREVQRQRGPVEGCDVAAADGGGGHVAGTPGECALLEQLVQIRARIASGVS
jgi:hypothetical protein